jgi:ADP-dependent NAD(P)H-hydrate dehydratase / NAD(P)H-hydrate epimerase
MEPGMPLYRCEDVRAIDRHVIEHDGVPAFVLMQRAAAAALQVLRARWPLARRLMVICGPGNNGGDGYVLRT